MNTNSVTVTIHLPPNLNNDFDHLMSIRPDTASKNSRISQII